jgi:hypothetical protein
MQRSQTATEQTPNIGQIDCLHARFEMHLRQLRQISKHMLCAIFTAVIQQQQQQQQQNITHHNIKHQSSVRLRFAIRRAVFDSQRRAVCLAPLDYSNPFLWFCFFSNETNDYRVMREMIP